MWVAAPYLVSRGKIADPPGQRPVCFHFDTFRHFSPLIAYCNYRIWVCTNFYKFTTCILNTSLSAQNWPHRNRTGPSCRDLEVWITCFTNLQVEPHYNSTPDKFEGCCHLSATRLKGLKADRPRPVRVTSILHCWLRAVAWKLVLRHSFLSPPSSPTSALHNPAVLGRRVPLVT